MQTHEIWLWGLPKGVTDPAKEALMASNCKNEADIEKVKAAASKDGWHTFRVSTWDGSPPDFAKTVNI
jgi:hypothetical protein